jgi:hypothetical protein
MAIGGRGGRRGKEESKGKGSNEMLRGIAVAGERNGRGEWGPQQAREVENQ